MTKRAFGKFERKARDFYATPEAAVLPLLPHLYPYVSFDEPCAGDAALVEIIEATGILCSYMSDIEPQIPQIEKKDVFDIKNCTGGMFITNPPWDRRILHPLIVHLSNMAPTWLLFDADWMHTKQSAQFMDRCRKIISVGRVSWIGNGTVDFDNCCWYLFDRPTDKLTEFHGRFAGGVN